MNVNTGDRHDAAPQSRANQVPVLVSLDQLRNLQVYALHGGDVVVDVTAYVTGPTSPTSEEGLYIQLLRPAPIWSPTFTPQDATASRQVAGTNAIATDAIGVTGIIELRADERAHATVHPADQTAPETSTVNARDGEHLYGHYTTALSPDGQLSVHSPFDASVSLALTGYYTGSIPEPGEPDDYEPAVLAYDAQQRLVETQTATGTTTGYGYWPDGTRAAQHHPNDTTTLYMGATDVTISSDGSVATATRTYTHADVLVAARTDTGGLEWLFGNHQGSITTTITNGTAETRWYTPYGNQRGPAPTDPPTTRGFLAQHEDTTGLTYLNNRYHDAVLGVFTSVDPLVMTTFEPYAYAGANPITYSDPTGLDPDTSAWVRERQQQGEQILRSVADDPWEFGSRLLMGLDQRPGSEAEWWLPTVGGELACVGQWACQRAYDHLLDHPYDVTGAQIYAATYCGCADGYVTSELRKTAGDLLTVFATGSQLRFEAGAAARMEARGRGRGGLSNSSNARIDPAKLTEYALNPQHPRGGNKARVIESKFGFNRSNALDLITQIREGVMTNSATLGKVDVHGVRYSVDIAVTGPTGSGVLRTAWIYDPGSLSPRLVTLYAP